MTRRAFALALVAIFAVGIALRVAWLRADPPVLGSVGVVWHDEGAWVHNARNRALWGQWRMDGDAWNPMFIAPVFTVLEYGSFRAFGVGLWQARVVPVVSGLAALAFLIAGLHALAGRKAAAIGGALLAANYVFVMWNRAALMESTMTAFIVGAWAAYARVPRRPEWGLLAGASAVLAWFAKASAAFFLAALTIEALTTLMTTRRGAAAIDGRESEVARARRGALLTLVGLGITATAVGIFFVWPHFAEYEFYNWQISVTRKPEYTLKALLDRASWLPVVQGLFTRMWLVLLAGCAGALAIAARWKTARPAERLLALWMLVGIIELIVHDSGNERRYVMFVPALIAIASALLAADGPLLEPDFASAGVGARVLAFPLVALAGYLIIGSFLRPVFFSDIEANQLHRIVRLSALLALVLALAVTWWWRPLIARMSAWRLPATVAVAGVVVTLAWDFIEYTDWAQHRAELNYQASVAVGRILAPGTLVQGKLANGLDLENQIRPLFVGNGFGNYDDRLRRNDARYILTYDLPRIGYESSVDSGLIQGILDAYPDHHAVATFEVDETPAPDRAVLFDKFPNGPPPHARD